MCMQYYISTNHKIFQVDEQDEDSQDEDDQDENEQDEDEQDENDQDEDDQDEDQFEGQDNNERTLNSQTSCIVKLKHYKTISPRLETLSLSVMKLQRSRKFHTKIRSVCACNTTVVKTYYRCAVRDCSGGTESSPIRTRERPVR